jgi:hypothetical protein
MLDLDLSDPINQVRALIGDIDGSFISDPNIEVLLTLNNDNVIKASIQALDYIIAQVAYYVREEAGDVEVYWGDIYERLVKRKEQVERDNIYKISSGLFKMGGTTRSEIDRVNSDIESKGVGERTEDFSAVLRKLEIDPDNPYLLERY